MTRDKYKGGKDFIKIKNKKKVYVIVKSLCGINEENNFKKCENIEQVKDKFNIT